MTAVLWIISLLLLIYLIVKAVPGIDLMKLAAFTVFGFFGLYTVVSAFFFWADCFTFTGTLLVCIAAETIVGVYFTKKNSGFKVSFCWKKNVIPILIVICALPFTWGKFQLYSMGQDQGTYQVKALYLMEQDTHNYIEMEEFNKLDTPEEKQKYLDFVYSQNNLYLPRVEWETDTDAAHFERIVGTIHGLPTYSALLALWGKVFGYRNMIGVQTPLYLAILLMTYFICENLRLRKSTAFFLTALMGFSPIVLWLSKSSLTEVAITLVICAFIYFLTLPAERKRPELCALPVVIFAFFHISIYAFMPVFVIVLFVMYLSERDKRWLNSVVISTVGYAVGTIWALMIAPYYSYGNYSELARVTGGFLNDKRLLPVVLTVCILLSALCILLKNSKWEAFVFRMADRILESQEKLQKAGFLFLRLFLLLSLAFFVYKGVIQGETTTACEYLQISTYIYMSGLIAVPLIYIMLFLKPSYFFENRLITSITILFLYCVVMYSMVMRVRILFYYYFARYAALFLIVIFLMTAKIVEKWKVPYACVFLSLMLLTFVPYDKGLPFQEDHTRCEWSFLKDVCEKITDRDAFVVGPEEQQIVFIFPVKALTGCDVYYADENLDGQLSKLAGKYEHVYYMDYDTKFEENFGDSEVLKGFQVEKVYNNWNHLSYLDYFNITNPITPIPINYVQYKLNLSLYEIGSEVEK